MIENTHYNQYKHINKWILPDLFVRSHFCPACISEEQMTLIL
jgi:hypothetical protein